MAVAVAAAEVVPVCAKNGLSEAVAVPLPVGEAAALTEKVAAALADAAAVAVAVCVDGAVAAADEVPVCVGAAGGARGPQRRRRGQWRRPRAAPQQLGRQRRRRHRRQRHGRRRRSRAPAGLVELTRRSRLAESRQNDRTPPIAPPRAGTRLHSTDARRAIDGRLQFLPIAARLAERSTPAAARLPLNYASIG